MERNLELDRLRAIAALMTLYMHYRQVFYPWSFTLEYQGPNSALDLLSNAWAGVDLFFVISGFIISKMLVSNLDHLRRNSERVSPTVLAFYVRRMFRIYPVAWLIVSLVIACAAFANQGGYFDSVVGYLKGSIGIFTYTFNFWFPDNKSAKLIPLAPYWSLSVEEQFYLAYPIFLLLIVRTRHRVLSLAGALALITFVIRPMSGGNPLHQFFYTQSRCDGLIYGCLLYFATAQPWFHELRHVVRGSRWFMRAVVLLVSLAITCVPAIGFDNTFVIPIVGVLSAVLVGIAACEGGAIDFPAPLRLAMDFIGRRSYTIYLLHIPLFYLTCELMYRHSKATGVTISPDLGGRYALTFAVLMLVCTEAIYRLIERPMIRRGQLSSSRILNRGASQPRPSGSTPRHDDADTGLLKEHGALAGSAGELGAEGVR